MSKFIVFLFAVFLIGIGFLAGTYPPVAERFDSLWEDVTAKISLRHEPTLASVAGREVTVREFKNDFGRMHEASRQQFSSPQGRRTSLEAIIGYRIMEAEAQRLGLRNGEKYRQELRQLKRSVLRQMYQDYVRSQTPIQEADIQRYYQEHADEFSVEKLPRASHIVLKSLDEAKKAQALLRKGQTFESVAQSLSINHSSTVEERGKDPEVERVVLTLKPGQISNIVKTRAGYEIIRNDGPAPASPQSLEAVKGQIRARLERELLFDKLGKARASIPIQVNVQLLNSLDLSPEALSK